MLQEHAKNIKYINLIEVNFNKTHEHLFKQSIIYLILFLHDIKYFIKSRGRFLKI